MAIHSSRRMGRLNTTFGQKCILYANYVPNVLRHGVLRDPNHSLRIDCTLRWFSKLGPSKRAVRPHTYLPIPKPHLEVGDQVVVVVSMRSGQRCIKRCKAASTAAGTSTILAK